MTQREILLKKISMYAFAVHELRMFLDTHPNDKATLKKIDEYEEKLKPLRTEYVKKYGPLMKSDDNTGYWNWVNDPWPWEGE